MGWPERSSNSPTRHWPATSATSIPTPRIFCWSRPGLAGAVRLPETLAAFARRSLERMGVEVLLDTPIEAIDREGVVARGQRIAGGNVSGAPASRPPRWRDGLACQPTRAAGSRSRPTLSCRVAPRSSSSATRSWSTGPNGRPAAWSRAGRQTAGPVCRRSDRPRSSAALVAPPFRYRDKGALATIGRHSAIADFGSVRLTGLVAWVLWGVVHIFFLIGFRNRMAVFLNWIWAWLTYGRGARLITGDTTELGLAAKPAPRAMPENSDPSARVHATRIPGEPCRQTVRHACVARLPVRSNVIPHQPIRRVEPPHRLRCRSPS